MRTIRVGFVGAGWMGAALLKRLVQRENVEICALLEPDAARGREALQSLGLARELLVRNFGQIIGNPDIDAVCLASPNAFHGPQSIAALQAGKHVFCEKPCATRFDEFAKQIELERANPGLVTFVDYILYFDRMETRLRNMIAQGVLGTVTQVQVNYRHPVNIAGDKVWKLKEETMGDAIGMGIVHSLSVIVDLMASQARPVGVFATSMAASVRGFEADPVWNIAIRFDNGATGFCFGNIDTGNGYDAYHNLYGTEGAFVFEPHLDRPLKARYWSHTTTGGSWIYPLDRERCETQGFEDLAWPNDMETPDSGNVVDHQTGTCIEHFLACIRTGSQSPLSFANSASIAEVGWAARLSAGTGREVALPLDWNYAGAFFK